MAHGAHWETLVVSVEDFVANRLPVVVRDARLGATFEHEGVQWIELLHGDGPVQTLVLCAVPPEAKATELRTLFPALVEGVPSTMNVHAVRVGDDESVVEVWAEGTVGERSVGFFAPFGHREAGAVAPGEAEVRLGALAYTIERLADTEIVITDPEAIARYAALSPLNGEDRGEEGPPEALHFDISQLRAYLPRDPGDDFEFQSVVEAVEPFAFDGATGWRFLVSLAPPDEPHPLRLYLYAMPHTLRGDVPGVGDAVRGVAWMQGLLPGTP